MQRNLDKDDIRDASDLLTHIDGWEKTGSYDEKAIEALDRWHVKRERIHREAEALYTQIYAAYEAYVDSYEAQHHSMEPERIAVDMMNHNMSDSHIGTIGRALDEIQIEGTDFAVMQQAVMTPTYEQRLWNVLHDVNSLLLEEDQCIRGTKEALKWTFAAKPGEVSGLYECGESDQSLFVLRKTKYYIGRQHRDLVPDQSLLHPVCQ